MDKLKTLELFSGYGTASFALKQLGVDFECIGYSDIDKYANQCFKQNHGSKELGDVTKINPKDLEDFDLLTGGFPCQTFSVAGKGMGELDSRGTLFNEIIRIAEVKNPRYMLLENVKGLMSKKHKPTFDKIISELYRIGYFVKWKVLNTKEHGIPQNRERVFFCCFRYWNDFCNFKFPDKEELKIFLKDIVETEVDKKYYLSNKMKDYVLATGTKGFSVKPEIDRDIAKTITATVHKMHRAGMDNYLSIKNATNKGYYIQRLEPKSDGTTNTISTVQKDNWLATSLAIRKLTPKECFRLQGFLNDEINLNDLSNTQRYKLAGNGWDINLVSKIFRGMLK